MRLYYDGLCPLCSREIDHYKKCRGAERIEFVDITSGDFDAVKEQLDPKAIHRHMHAKTSDGSVVTGVNAFILVWEQLPAYRWLAKIIRWPPAHWVAEVGYRVFARVRPLLPRRKRDCESSPYCE